MNNQLSSLQSHKPSVKTKSNFSFPFINPLEHTSELFKQTGEVIKHETRESLDAFWRQVLGADKYKKKDTAHSLEMRAGEDYALPKRRKEHLRPAIDYHREIREAGTKTSERQSAEIRQQIQEIVVELQRISSASKTLEKAVTEATGQSMVKPGKYQLHFFQWLLLDIRQARMKVEDATTWLHTTNQKANRKTGKMSTNLSANLKEFGSKVMMSGERTQANNAA